MLEALEACLPLCSTGARALPYSPLPVSCWVPRKDEGVLPAARAHGVLGGQHHLSVSTHALQHRHLPLLERQPEPALHDPRAPECQRLPAAHPAAPHPRPAKGGGPHLPAQLPDPNEESFSSVWLQETAWTLLGCPPTAENGDLRGLFCPGSRGGGHGWASARCRLSLGGPAGKGGWRVGKVNRGLGTPTQAPSPGTDSAVLISLGTEEAGEEASPSPCADT